MTEFLFYLFALILLLSGFMVITTKSMVHAALYLVLAFFNAACLWMMLKAEFLAITLILVYVGAVMVLFLFVVMMLDYRHPEGEKSVWSHLPFASVIGVIIAVEMSMVLLGSYRVTTEAVPNADMLNIANTRLLGIEIYTKYLYPLELAAVLLLVAMIAAIALTLRHRKDAKGQNPAQQVRVRKSDRLRILQIPAVRPTASAEQQQGKAS